MSKFNNARRTLGNAALKDVPPVAPVPPASGVEPRDGRLSIPEAPAPVTAKRTHGAVAGQYSSILQPAGFFVLCAYLMSEVLLDWTHRLTGDKVYVSAVALVLMPVFWLLSGRALRGLQHPIGRWWLGFLALLCAATPFSVWIRGSALLLLNYAPRSYLIFFLICCFTSTLRQCRILMYVNIVNGVLVLLTCLKFGAADGFDGRFRIPESIFFSNANELAMQLLLGITMFLYLFYEGGIAKGIFGAGAIGLSIVYLLRTGSRGCIVAAALLAVVAFVVSKEKLKFGLVLAPLALLAFLTIPDSTIHRLQNIVAPAPGAAAATEADIAGLESSKQRQFLFSKSVSYTLQHPLFGVGPGQFPVALFGEAQKSGVHAAWLGTHNSYTQVSSECGIPALICYCAVLLLSIRTSYRLFRRARGVANLKQVSGLSFCLFCGLVGYAIATFFFHMAYTGALPLLAGFALALRNAAAPLLPRKI